MKKRVFVSDVHMSTGWSFGKDGQYDWLSVEQSQAFGDFLAEINKDTATEEVILLGDIMDDWVYPVDTVPPSYHAVINAPHILKKVSYLYCRESFLRNKLGRRNFEKKGSKIV